MKMTKVELNEKDLEFICLGLYTYMQKSLRNLKESSQETVKTTLRKMEEARDKLWLSNKEKLRQMINITKHICPYCTYSSDELFPIEHYEGGSSGYRTFRCPSCGKEIEE